MNTKYVKLFMIISLVTTICFLVTVLPIDIKEHTINDKYEPSDLVYVMLYIIVIVNGVNLQVLPYCIFGKLANDTSSWKDHVIAPAFNILQLVLIVIACSTYDYNNKLSIVVVALNCVAVICLIVTYNKLSFGLCAGNYGLMMATLVNLFWISVALITYGNLKIYSNTVGIISTCYSVVIYLNILVCQTYHRYQHKKQLELEVVNNMGL